MELEKPRSETPGMTFDELSMERSKSFLTALQELKNLRPQLYSAAEHCESSYLRSEQKQIVVDNLKDYAVRVLVNAVDHLGTVAYKLNDLLEQQTSDVSNMELKVTCLNQQLLTCQIYTDKEGLRQQQLLAFVPRHHKHYILPNSVNKKVHFSPHVQTTQNPFQAGPHNRPSEKTLSWHLASEPNPTMQGTKHDLTSAVGQKISWRTSGQFHLIDSDEGIRARSSGTHLQLSSGIPAATEARRSFGVTKKDKAESSKAFTAFGRFEDLPRREVVRAPVRSKSLLSAFFVKQKTQEMKAGSVS